MKLYNANIFVVIFLIIMHFTIQFGFSISSEENVILKEKIVKSERSI